jgi:hypothetical protein
MAGHESPPPPSGQTPSVDDYIEIWWAGDRVYYRGTVVSFNKETGEHCILYDDGDSGSYDMAKESWRMLRSASALAAARLVLDAARTHAVTPGDAQGAALENCRERDQHCAVQSGTGDAIAAQETDVRGDIPDVTFVEKDQAASVRASLGELCDAAAGASAAEITTMDVQVLPPGDTTSKRDTAEGVLEDKPDGNTSRNGAGNCGGRRRGQGAKGGSTGRGSRAGRMEKQTRNENDDQGLTMAQGRDSRAGELHVEGSSNARNASRQKRLRGPEHVDDGAYPLAHAVTLHIAPEQRSDAPRVDAPPQPAMNSMSGQPGNDSSCPQPSIDNMPAQPRNENTLPPDKRPDRRRGSDPQGETEPAVATDDSVLPLDHVMTAVVQTIVLILDERLRPIAKRMEELSAELHQASPDSVSQMACDKHAEHLKEIDDMRKEIKRLRTEHRAVITETLAIKEAELKDCFEFALDRAVGEISVHCESTLVAAARTASAAAVTSSVPLVPAANRASSIVPTSVIGSQGSRPPSTSQATVNLGRRLSKVREKRKRSQPDIESNPETPLVDATRVAPVQLIGSQTMQPGPQNYPNLATPGLPVGAEDDADAMIKRKTLAIVARQVTVWLLETQHECSHPSKRLRWARETGRTCLLDVAEKLSGFVSYDQALRTLSSCLGDDNVELSWFLECPSLDNLRLARHNYSAWEPPPTDSEWSLEQHLLRDLSVQYHWGLASYKPSSMQNEVRLGVEVARIVAAGYPNPVPNPGEWPMGQFVANGGGGTMLSGRDNEATAAGQSMRTGVAAAGLAGDIAGSGGVGSGQTNILSAYKMSSAQAPIADINERGNTTLPGGSGRPS